VTGEFNSVSDLLSKPSTAFVGDRQLLSGPLVEVALAVKRAMEHGTPTQYLVFDDATGRVIDLDLRGTKAEIIERLSRPPQRFVGRYTSGEDNPAEIAKKRASEPRGPGRPKLGVVSREVTLLPIQWEWLASQPGGASSILRRLVDEARRNPGPLQQRRAAHEAAYHFMLAIAGNRPGYEEATRALFADDRSQLKRRTAAWPRDIRAHVIRLAFPPDAQRLRNNARDRSRR